MRFRQVLVILGLLIGAAATHAQPDSPFVFGPEEVVPKSVKPGEKWKEGRVRLPDWPRDQDLVPLSLDRADSRFTYSVDTRSLSIGEDGVVRYTLVAETATGNRNLSFEGLRCTPNGAHRVYAFGQDGRFQIMPGDSDWQGIDRTGADPARHELWRHYLCVPRLFKPRPKRDQVRMLRSGRVPEIENRGFLTN
jgi:hypothetical protein